MSDFVLLVVFLLSLCIGWIPVKISSYIMNHDNKDKKDNTMKSLLCDIMKKKKNKSK